MSTSRRSDDGFRLTVERGLRRHLERYARPTTAEAFPGPRSMEDLRLYRTTRALLRKARQVKVREYVVRSLERPPNVDGQVEERVPQFFLRNIRRVERWVEDSESPYVEVRTRDRVAEDVSAQYRGLRYEPPRLLDHWNMTDVLWFRAMIKRYFHEEDWRTRFGRELKERVQGPLWKYEPRKGGT